MKVEEREVTILTWCPSCGGTNEVTISLASYLKWQREGELIQFAMPDLSADEREMLMTGTCPPCWDKMFGEDDE